MFRHSWAVGYVYVLNEFTTLHMHKVHRIKMFQRVIVLVFTCTTDIVWSYKI